MSKISPNSMDVKHSGEVVEFENRTLGDVALSGDNPNDTKVPCSNNEYKGKVLNTYEDSL